MKKHFYLLIFFFAITLYSQAQIKKGQVLIGGDINAYSETTDPGDPNNSISKQSSINLSPSIGFAIKDNLLAGFDLNYQGSKVTDGPPSTVTTTNVNHIYGLGFFLRRYKYLGAGFSLFMQGRLGVSYNTGKTNYDVSPVNFNDAKGYAINLGFYPGVSYAITRRVQLETGFQNLVEANYSHLKNTVPDNAGTGNTYYKTNTIGLGTGLNNSLLGFVIGFKVLLGS